MIRLPPSLITIGLGDIKDYDRRTKRRAKLQLNPQAAPFKHQIILPIRSISHRSRIYSPSADTIASTDGSHFTNEPNQGPVQSRNIPRLASPLPLECIIQMPAHAHTQDSDISEWENASPRSSDGTITNNQFVDGSSLEVELPEIHNVRKSETFEEWLDARRGKIFDVPDTQSSQDSVELEAGDESFENTGIRRLSSPSKDNFDYGGFVESPSQQESDQSRGSSPFEPEDASTTPHIQAPASQRLPARTRLPRSPLFLAQNASSSPERHTTASLTPRVVSRIATHNTPGFLFAQPARRPGPSPHIQSTRQPRTLRHQTNSFSFDDSERSSVAYEQERALSSSTTDSRPRPSESLNLRQELRGSSLQSSRIPSFASSVRSQERPPSDRAVLIESQEIESETNTYEPVINEEMDPHSLVSIAEQSIISTAISVHRSKQLTLPPPFSTVSRSASRAGSLPSSPSDAYQSKASPTSIVRSSSSGPSGSPSRNISVSSSVISQLIREHDERQASSPASVGRRRLNPIVRAAARLFSSPNSRSPQRNSPPPSPSPSPRRRRTRPQPTPRRDSDTGPQTYTPSRGYSVYNDSLPAASQPQTPAHLPEARHQSRYHPSYTAPTTRSMGRLRNVLTEHGSSTPIRPSDPFHQDSSQRWMMYVTDARRARQRSGSPAGMSDDGFRGLYGGRENGDDEQSWIDGVRARNAEMRNWQTRSDEGRLEDDE